MFRGLRFSLRDLSPEPHLLNLGQHWESQNGKEPVIGMKTVIIYGLSSSRFGDTLYVLGYRFARRIFVFVEEWGLSSYKPPQIYNGSILGCFVFFQRLEPWAPSMGP